MAKNKIIYVVRKHITVAATGKEIRHEDYPQQFKKLFDAICLLLEKEEKYRQTVRDYMDEGSEISEGRWYEIVPKRMPKYTKKMRTKCAWVIAKSLRSNVSGIFYFQNI